MPFPLKYPDGRRVEALRSQQLPETGYTPQDITRINHVFRICEDIFLEYPVSTEIHTEILNNLANEGCGIGSDDDVVEIYNFVENGRGILPENRAQVMSAIQNFTANLPARSLSRRGGILGCWQTGAGLWDDSLNSADSMLTEAQDVLRVVIPGESHAAGSLSNLWRSPPGYTTTSTTVSVPPPSVTGQSYRDARGVLRVRYHRTTDVLNGITRIARLTFIVTQINTIWQFGRSFYDFHQNSARWRTTLEAFRDDPTPENLAAYGIVSGNMVNNISNMVTNIPASPTGSIPFYGNIFTNVGNFTTHLISLLGYRLSTVDTSLAGFQAAADGYTAPPGSAEHLRSRAADYIP